MPTARSPPPPDAEPSPRMQTRLYADPPSLWIEGMTHACENITLPQTSFAGVNYITATSFHSLWTVADPGFPGGESVSLKDEGKNLLFWPIFPKNCMKMKINVGPGAHP